MLSEKFEKIYVYNTQHELLHINAINLKKKRVRCSIIKQRKVTSSLLNILSVLDVSN